MIEYRDNHLKSLGITTLRFKNENIWYEIDEVLTKIRQAITTPSSWEVR